MEINYDAIWKGAADLQHNKVNLGESFFLQRPSRLLENTCHDSQRKLFESFNSHFVFSVVLLLRGNKQFYRHCMFLIT